MNVLNQEIQAIEYQIAYYKKKKEKYDVLFFHFYMLKIKKKKCLYKIIFFLMSNHLSPK
jgi:hypothetical protein